MMLIARSILFRPSSLSSLVRVRVRVRVRARVKVRARVRVRVRVSSCAPLLEQPAIVSRSW